MSSHEDDILPETLHANLAFVDCFYALDGTVPNTESRAIITGSEKCAGYITDAEIDYGPLARDGWRQKLLEMAVADHGHDHWFLLLHGDELWTGLPDLDTDRDGFMFSLPCYFPRDGEPWDDGRSPVEQLRWHLAPGAREFRMFRGGPHIAFDPQQHANVVPAGVSAIGGCDEPIRHYLYRSPAVQRARAVRHAQTRFDPHNYQHILSHDAVYWTDDMIESEKRHHHYRELACL
jgi:hypothetical protein